MYMYICDSYDLRITVVPCLCREEFSLENAALQIIRGGTAPLDIATVQTCDGKKHYMTLLNCWGMVADVDIESERWRKLGDTRFILGEWMRL